VVDVVDSVESVPPIRPAIRRLAKPGPELEAVYQEILVPSFDPAELNTLDEISESMLSGRTSVWISVDRDDRILGTAIGEFEAEQRIVLLAWMAVRPGLRGGGVGGPLLRAALDAWEGEYGPCLILTEVADPAGHSFHEAHGDPSARLRFYRRLGGRVLDLPYFQAALGPGLGRVDDFLLLVLRSHPAFGGEESDTVDGAVLRSYLEAYQLECEGAVATDPQAMRLWRAVDRPGGVGFRG
jgi:GNAT superfamily N-acetyltransferase